MRPYGGTNPQAIPDAVTRSAVMALHDFALQLNAGVDTQRQIYQQGTTTINQIGVTAHSALTGLALDDHQQYALLAGRVAGQTLYGGLSATDVLTIHSSSSPFYPNSIRVSSTAAEPPALVIEDPTTYGVGGLHELLRLQYASSAGTGNLFVIRKTNGTPRDMLSFTGSDSTSTLTVGNSNGAVYTMSTSTGFTLKGNQMGGSAGSPIKIDVGTSFDAMLIRDGAGSTTLAKITKEGYFDTPRLRLMDATGDLLTMVPNATTTAYTITWPAAQGAASTVLTNNGSGTLTWATPAGGTNALLDGTNHTDTTNSACTRGDIVIGNSSALWDDLPIGGSNTVLVSNGTDPSWAAIDKAYISNRTRTIFLGPDLFSGTKSTSGSNPNVIARISMSGSVDANASINWAVPSDYVSGFVYDVYYSSAGTSVNQVDWFASVLALTVGVDTTAAGSSTETFSSFPPGTANLLDITTGHGGGLSGSFAADQVVRLVIQRTGSSDSNNDSINFHGILVSYTADM